MRISQPTEVGGAVVLRLEGKVRGQWVDELRTRDVGNPATSPPLDLSWISPKSHSSTATVSSFFVNCHREMSS